MDLKLLKADILSNNIPNFIIFSVSEPVLSKQYLSKMSSTLNKYYKYYDSYKEVIYDVDYNIKEDFIYIILDDYEILDNPAILDKLIGYDRHIVAYYSSPEILYKKIQKKYLDYVVKFDAIDKPTIIAYLLKLLKTNKITIDQDKLATLVDYCNCNFSICINEIDKIITLNQENSNLLIDYIFNNGFSDYRKINIFNFIQKILNKDESVFYDLYKLDDSVITVFDLLYKQARIRFLKSGNKFYVKLMQLIFKLDCGIKDGSVNSDIAINYLLLKGFYE